MNIQIPQEIVHAEKDSVSYSIAHSPFGKKLTQKHSDICYRNCMTALPTYEYHLYPNAKSILPSEIFLKWISLCKENEIIPHEADATSTNGLNSLFVPHKSYNRHLVYATLCCYRWSENKAKIPYETVKITESGLPFFQALHYALAKHLTFEHGNHSFLPIVNLSSTSSFYNICGYGKGNKHYLPWSIVGKYFFTVQKDGRSVADIVGDNCPQQYGYGSTVSSIHDKLKELGFDEEIQELKLDLEEIIDPKFSKLYTIESPHRKNCSHF